MPVSETWFMLSYHKSPVLLLLCLSWALALYVAHHDGKALAGPTSLFASAFSVSQLPQPRFPGEHQLQLWPSTQRLSSLAPWPAGVHTHLK